jgi:tetratricopeptide (TPR) repeat protein
MEGQDNGIGKSEPSDARIALFFKGIVSVLEAIPFPQEEAPSLQNIMQQSQSSYREALEYLLKKKELQPIGFKILQALEEKGIEAALQILSDEDISAIEREAEMLMQQGKAELSGKLFQLLTLFLNDGNCNLYAYMMLAEDVANRDITTASKIYDFLVNFFPDNPVLLLSAAECHKDAQQFSSALSFLEKADHLYSDLGQDAENPTMAGIRENIQELTQEVKRQLATSAAN